MTKLSFLYCTLTCLLFIQPLSAKTEHSKLVDYLQKTYADQGQDYPILIMDQDELDLRYARENAFGTDKTKEVLRTQILKAYILEKSGANLSDNDVRSIEPLTSTRKNGAHAMPIFDGHPEIKYKFCGVFPASVNSNRALETHRILALDTPDAYPATTYSKLKERIPYNVLTMYSIVHELGHCLDKTFMPKIYASYQPDAHDIHRSESFAETFATFMLIKEGYDNWAKTRALFRNLYALNMGQWFIDHPKYGFGNPMYFKGGLIYYLAPSLLAANRLINKNHDLKNWSVADYLSTAKQVVNEYDISSRGFYAIFRGLSENRDDTLNIYRGYALDSPDLFNQAYSEVVTFFDLTPYLENQLLSDTITLAPGESQSLVPLDKTSLADMLQRYNNDPSESNHDILDEQIDLYRANLEQAQYLDYKDQLDRKKELDDLWNFVLN